METVFELMEIINYLKNIQNRYFSKKFRDNIKISMKHIKSTDFLIPFQSNS